MGTQRKGQLILLGEKKERNSHAGSIEYMPGALIKLPHLVLHALLIPQFIRQESFEWAFE